MARSGAPAQPADARPADPYLRWEVVPGAVRQSWSGQSATAWIAPSAYHGKLWLTCLGDPEASVDLTARALAGPLGPAVAGISVPQGAEDLLRADVRPPQWERWTWWWTRRPPDIGATAAGEVVVLAEDDPRLPPLLAESRSVYLRPGDPRVRQWWGIDCHGALLACLAVESHHPQVPHLASVVVAAQERGRGYATKLCSAVVVDRFAAGAPAVTLAMMSANTAARRLYSRLGFHAGPSFASGTLPGRRGLPRQPGWPLLRREEAPG